jgi:DNA (cytosine-5)-methyltransferase 1
MGLGIGKEGDPCPTLTKAHSHTVAYSFDSLGSNSMKSKNPNSGCRPVELSKTLDTTIPEPSKNQGGIAIVESNNVPSPDNEIVGSLCARDSKVVGSQYVNEGKVIPCRSQAMQNMAVRRLTPIECERLQGFPDNYTQIAWRNKQPENCPDSHRYKALGNSMAVPVMRWIGQRIDTVNKLKDI